MATVCRLYSNQPDHSARPRLAPRVFVRAATTYRARSERGDILGW